MRILTWNIGCFIFLKYKNLHKGIIDHSLEYFQPKLNGNFVSGVIGDTGADVIFLQEFWQSEHVEMISSLKQYPYLFFMDMWYRKSGALIASKFPFTHKIEDDVTSIECEGYKIFPVHLNSYFSNERLRESNSIICRIQKDEKTIILGDFNIWSWGNFFPCRQDRKIYLNFKSVLHDASVGLKTTFLRTGLDKIFVSQNMVVQRCEVLGTRGICMDHYPLCVDIE